MGKIKDINLRALERGFEVSYCKVTMKQGEGAYPSMDHDYKTEAFTELPEAVKRFGELTGYSESADMDD